MAVPNIYLKNLVVHDTIMPRCFCNGCRILDDISYDPQVASIIGNRLQSDMVAHCRRRYQPY